MSKQRSKTEWVALFKEQQTSGLSTLAFCRKHKINYNYFCTRRSDFKSKSIKPKLIQAVSPRVMRPNVVLRYNDIEIDMTYSSVDQVAQLVKALA